MIKKRLLLIIIMSIFLLSSLVFFLILNYLDPYEFKTLSVFLLWFTFMLWLSSFFTIIFYFLKKVYFRWKVYLCNVLSSFRQGFFVSLFIILLIVFKKIWAWTSLAYFLLFLFISFLELFIQNITE